MKRGLRRRTARGHSCGGQDLPGPVGHTERSAAGPNCLYARARAFAPVCIRSSCNLHSSHFPPRCTLFTRASVYHREAVSTASRPEERARLTMVRLQPSVRISLPARHMTQEPINIELRTFSWVPTIANSRISGALFKLPRKPLADAERHRAQRGWNSVMRLCSMKISTWLAQPRGPDCELAHLGNYVLEHIRRNEHLSVRLPRHSAHDPSLRV